MSVPSGSAYCISKYGVEAFSDALRREMSPWGVLVSMIEPGRFKTSITSSVVESVKRFWDDLSPELKKYYGEKYLHKCKLILYLIPAFHPIKGGVRLSWFKMADKSRFTYLRMRLHLRYTWFTRSTQTLTQGNTHSTEELSIFNTSRSER